VQVISMDSIRRRLSYANVISSLCLFLLLGGGTAVALNGQNTVQSDDLGPGAQVKAADISNNAVGSSDVVNESITGADVKNQSGVDTCIAGSLRRGPLCVGAADAGDNWNAALRRCAAFDLRLPSLGEAMALVKNHEIPNGVLAIWTDELTVVSGNQAAFVVLSDGGYTATPVGNGGFGTACVTTPTN
jgi:hypothetical protein